MRKRIFTSVIILLSLSSAFHVSRAGNNTAQVDAGKQSEDSRGDVLRSSTLSGAWSIDKPHPKQGGFEGHLAARRAICQAQDTCGNSHSPPGRNIPNSGQCRM